MAADRYVVISALIPDRPGQLERVLSLIAQHRGNVVTVSHNRTDPMLAVDECAVIVEVEVRGVGHADELREALREDGHGAFRLYESVGFRVVRSWTTLHKPLAQAPASARV